MLTIQLTMSNVFTENGTSVRFIWTLSRVGVLATMQQTGHRRQHPKVAARLSYLDGRAVRLVGDKSYIGEAIYLSV